MTWDTFEVAFIILIFAWKNIHGGYYLKRHRNYSAVAVSSMDVNVEGLAINVRIFTAQRKLQCLQHSTCLRKRKAMYVSHITRIIT